MPTVEQESSHSHRTIMHDSTSAVDVDLVQRFSVSIVGSSLREVGLSSLLRDSKLRQPSALVFICADPLLVCLSQQLRYMQSHACLSFCVKP